MEEHVLALSKAKIQLMSKPDTTFYTSVCFRLVHKWDTSIRTAATNGKQILFNPKFFMSLTQEERVFLLLHETMHVAYMHMLRVGDRNKAKFNIAADHVINLQLIKQGFTMPKGGYADSQYSNMSTEAVYTLLPDQDTSDVDMDIQEATSTDELEQELEEIIISASIQAKMQDDKSYSNIAGEIRIFLDKLLNPKLPWQKILRKYMQTLTKNDYSFRRPNRRYFPKYHMPSMFSDSLMDITIAVDASGSVSDIEFKRFVSEANGIIKSLRPETMTLIQFDTQIISVDHIKSIHDLSQVVFTGRGGTSIEPVMAWAEENKPKVLLVFTDGYFRFYKDKSKQDVVWLIHNNDQFEAPYGKVIHYTITE